MRRNSASGLKPVIQRSGVSASVMTMNRSVQIPEWLVMVSTGFTPRSPKNAL